MRDTETHMVRFGRSVSLMLVLLLFACGVDSPPVEEVDGDVQAVEIPEPNRYEFGSDFVLTDQDGKPFDTASLRGSAVLLFFGYTHCPDACPTTLSRLNRVYDLLGEEGGDVRTVYVTVDVARDTSRRLKEYLSYYGLPIVGLTGTQEEVDFAAGEYGAYHKVSDEVSEAGPLFDHTLLVYLIDAEGVLRYLFQPGESPEVMAGVIGKVLKERR
jgi:protein SCO1/2